MWPGAVAGTVVRRPVASHFNSAPVGVEWHCAWAAGRGPLLPRQAGMHSGWLFDARKKLPVLLGNWGSSWPPPALHALHWWKSQVSGAARVRAGRPADAWQLAYGAEGGRRNETAGG